MNVNFFCVILGEAALMATICASGAVTKGENAEDFAAVCGLVQFAKAEVTDATQPQEIENVINTLVAINFTLMDEQTRTTVEKNKGKTWDQIQEQHTGATKYYGEHWPRWTRVANLDESNGEAKSLKDWAKHRNHQAVKKQIAHLLSEALALKLSAAAETDKLKATKITEPQTKALYGDAGEAAEIKFSESDRSTFCGKGANGASAPGTMVGEGLYHVLLCLCAGEATDATAGQGCCERCNGAPNNGAWSENTEGKPRAEFLAEKCSSYIIPASPSRTELSSRLAAFVSRANQHKGNGKAKTYIMGAVGGTGAEGCTGQVGGTNKGRCAKFSEAQIVGTDASLKWRAKLEEAAEAWENRQQALNKLEAVASKLKLINTTAASLLYAESAQIAQQQAKSSAPNTSPEPNCPSHKTNTTCTENNCKWDSKEESEGDFCKPKDGEGQTKTAGSGGDEAAATKEEGKKCSDKKKEEDCKSPDCKW
uniref:Variant surface glycoprotein 1125.1107 n=1 Tax=Trypanosoma brucei TaxID=5691 RepID=A0A1J0R6A8_9TRYP|nr:variant surface glycoprotein 1125.1107 [Trypanosoma brucei]